MHVVHRTGFFPSKIKNSEKVFVKYNQRKRVYHANIHPFFPKSKPSNSNIFFFPSSLLQSNPSPNPNQISPSTSMAYVDHAFSISDEDIMMDSDSTYTVHNRPPIKEIALAVSLLVFGVTGIVSGIFMAVNRVGGDTGHGLFFAILGAVLFIPGFYYTRIAYYAYKGYKGFSFSNIPPV
ncbi:hypothetical protein HanRHA438_Chr05g0211391 [Helianthus annuus]|nr:hypothetical protein HanRHA438_Chr05g0211391 [Helianthus annuus]